mmetsp:Transcript_31788/g.94480  ORF Transcript_31788/g.94480 Transcript_31788/m.94480 type:complete len:295 (-) Transcript_31788:434-1318(-)
MACAAGPEGCHRRGEDGQRQDSRLPVAWLHQGQARGDEGRGVRLRSQEGPGHARLRAHARALPADLRGERSLRQARGDHHRLRLRRRAAAAADPRALERAALRRGHAGTPERLPQGRLAEDRELLLPCPRRGRPHAGHGLRATDPQHHPADPPDEADPAVHRDLAARGALAGQRVPPEADPRADGYRGRPHREQGHRAARHLLPDRAGEGADSDAAPRAALRSIRRGRQVPDLLRDEAVLRGACERPHALPRRPRGANPRRHGAEREDKRAGLVQVGEISYHGGHRRRGPRHRR